MGISGGGVAATAVQLEGGSSNVTSNATTSSENHFNSTTEMPQIPSYIRTTSMFVCISIMILGVIGNVMVPIVILKTKDMRNSTNIFLTNLSIADLLVLLVCTPTVLVEVNTRPETWVLGQEMCKAVPFVELTVAHASVLTILAISFERYYAICEPLKAGYVCTKTRAFLICVFAWGVAALFTSPILWVAEYKFVEYFDGSYVAACLTQAVTTWTIAFFLMTISIFFVIPLIILIILYGIIAKNLISKDGPMMKIRPTKPEFSYKARKQVVMMLGAVVLSFFLCLLPFRVLTLWIILSSDQALFAVGVERYYNLLYFSRIMLYLNSAINPILYNLMSTKFRKGFLKLCICCKPFAKTFQFRHRTPTLTTNTTSSSFLSRSSNRRPSDDLRNRVGLKIDLQQKECEVGMLSSKSKCDSSTVIDECRKLSLANNRRKLSSLDNEDEDEVIAIGVTMAEPDEGNANSNIKDHPDEARGKLLNCRKKCKRQISFDENVIVNSERGVNGERIVYQTSLEDKICGSGKKDTSVINFLPTQSLRNSLQK
ncbi:growth hormone secretagogue receptor type 1 [Eupeodes corollae]|uniref:growth hormone secretagogue receptor type 1 n=1 Tax=Eupeodes corollae TaxID=290404 RepID=UPI002491F37F|nr:growth hormone secretagogue receptor type 1 [Eupeodes corollae]